MITLNTTLLQSMTLKASRGASNNKMLPITSMMAIVVEQGDGLSKISLCTTDGTNYLYILNTMPKTDDLYVVVPQDQFSKLISKITTETVTLNLDNDKLVVKGNGIYNIELPLDENGELVKFPNPVKNIDKGEEKVINSNSIKSILTHNKPSLLTEYDVPCYTGYYMDKDGVLTTDTYTLCSNEINLFDTPVLVNKETLDLLDIMAESEIKVVSTDKCLVFSTPTCVVYSVKMPSVNEFNVDTLRKLVNVAHTSMVKLHKNTLIGALDRLSLFIGRYDKNKIILNFKQNELEISSSSTSGVEKIPYKESENAGEQTCAISIDLLLPQLKAQEGDIIELWYGAGSSIKMVDGDVSHIVALMENN